jgi:hypothetical protein
MVGELVVQWVAVRADQSVVVRVFSLADPKVVAKAGLLADG